MNVKHLTQVRLFRKAVAHDVESNIAAKRTPGTQEVMVGVGFQDQFRRFHGNMMPQAQRFGNKASLSV